MDGFLIGIAVRGDGPTREFVRALETMRTSHEANHNYSIWLSHDPKMFQRLQWGGCTAVRTRDPNRFGRALALHLSGHGAPPKGLVRVDGLVVVHDRQATVLPPSLRGQIPTYDRPLRQAGVILHDAPWVDVDPHTGEVVLEPPALALSAFQEVADRLPRATRPDPVSEPGRYQVTNWFLAAPGSTPISVADAVTAVLGSLSWPVTSDNDLAAVTALFDQTPFDRMAFRTPRELLERIGR